MGGKLPFARQAQEWVESCHQAAGAAPTWIGLHIAIFDAILRPSMVAELKAASFSRPVRLIRSNVFVAISRMRASW